MSKKVNLNELISLQVILKTSSGIPITDSSKITAENIESYKPEPETYPKVKKVFSDLGFEVGPLIGISFSIAAKASLFNQIFEVKFEKESRGNIICMNRDGSVNRKLELIKIPEIIRDKIHSIICPGPIDFGPVDFLK